MILIYTQHPSSRLEYAAEVIFRWVLKLKVPVTITREAEEYTQFNGRKINYSEVNLKDGLHIPPSGFLFQSGVKPAFPGITHGAYGKALFPVDGSEDFVYDVFSAVFYMVSRYEEYLPHETDSYDRYKPENSIAYQHNFLNKPMVHYWAEELKDKLVLRYPEYEFPVKKFRVEATIDVDNGFAYLGKGVLRTFGGYGKDLIKGRVRSMEERTHVLTGNKKDPFDHYKYQNKVCKKLNIPLRYFILTSGKTEFDHSLDPESRAFRKLVKKLQKCGKIGLHPSYYTYLDAQKTESELKKLKEVAKRRKLVVSRQHFLRMKFPETYQNLLKSGIIRDYSMGYASIAGFRAGIAEPFPFYDVTEEKRTSLIVRPFAVMETAYRDYQKYQPEDALIHMETMMEEVKKVSGLFILVWHDRSFAPWPESKGWKQVFTELLKLATRK